ncbi:MAG: hypothetical protein ABI624_20195, partial [Casimicrobiaceae bacterium]
MRVPVLARLLAAAIALGSLTSALGAIVTGEANDAGFVPRLVVKFKAVSDRSAQRTEDRVAQLA